MNTLDSKQPQSSNHRQLAATTIEYAILATILGLLMIALAITVRPASSRLFQKQTRILKSRPVPYSIVPMTSRAP